MIHRLYTNSHLPAGVRNSTAEVEQELLQVRIRSVVPIDPKL